ncbi:MAG: hypothetical protein ACOYOK_16395 [Pseudobdellovibrionaceae bacterium]
MKKIILATLLAVHAQSYAQPNSTNQDIEKLFNTKAKNGVGTLYQINKDENGNPKYHDTFMQFYKNENGSVVFEKCSLEKQECETIGNKSGYSAEVLKQRANKMSLQGIGIGTIEAVLMGASLFAGVAPARWLLSKGLVSLAAGQFIGLAGVGASLAIVKTKIDNFEKKYSHYSISGKFGPSSTMRGASATGSEPIYYADKNGKFLTDTNGKRIQCVECKATISKIEDIETFVYNMEKGLEAIPSKTNAHPTSQVDQSPLPTLVAP